MLDYPIPCPCDTPAPSDTDLLKDGLSERKPLFDRLGDTRVSQTPRTRSIESHNQENKEHAY